MHKVRVQNYQAVEDSSVEIEGFTAIVGPTNIGKSCLVRAIRALVTNQSGTSFIRNGASRAVVTLQGRDLDVTWSKGSGGGSYMLNGEPFDSIGRGQPDFLNQIGFGHIESGDQTVMPQIAPQFELPFLMDKSGAYVAEAISNVSGIERITPAVKAAEGDLRDTKSKLKLREADLQTAQDHLKQFAGTPDALLLVDAASAAGADVALLEAALAKLVAFAQLVSTSARRAKALQPVALVSVPLIDALVSVSDEVALNARLSLSYDKAFAALELLRGVDLVAVPPVDNLLVTGAFVDTLADLRSKYAATSASCAVLAGVADVSIPDVEGLGRLASDVQALVSLCSAHRIAAESYASLQGVSEIVVPDLASVEVHQRSQSKLSDFVRRLAAAAAQVRSLRGVSEVVVPVCSLDTLELERLNLQRLYGALSAAQRDADQGELALSQSVADSALADTAFHDAMGETCPLCERSYERI
jgi:energy-coupling factor transporter ATP-binding protein EcfA2